MMLPLFATIVIRASAVLALALVATRLARRSSASTRHAMLAACFAVLLVLPISSVVAPTIRISLPIAVHNTLVPSFIDEASSDVFPVQDERHDVMQKRAAADPSVSYSDVLLSVWCFAAIGFLLPIGAGLWEIRALRKSGARWPEAQATLESLAGHARVRRRIDLLIHHRVSGPMTCGVVRPTIFLPIEAAKWAEDDLRRAITHELEHVKRNDWLSQCFARAACAVYWFHPLVWIGWRQLLLEAERACDDAVLRHAEPTAYANQLVELAQHLSSSLRRPFPAMASPRDLRMRIRAVLDPSQRRGPARAFCLSVVCASAVACVIAGSRFTIVSAAQVPAQQRTFEVASIKPAPEDEPAAMHIQSARLVTRGPVGSLIQGAYQLQPFQLVAAPEWIASEAYEVEATADGSPNRSDMLLMLQSLLRDRFQLRVHRESRELPVYALVAGRGGIKLSAPRNENCEEETELLGALANPGARMPLPGEATVGSKCGRMDVTLEARGARLQGSKVQMSEFVRVLSRVLGRPVTDRTGFSGAFDVTLDYLPDDSTVGAPPPPPGAIAPELASASIFTAVQQLGLRLESARGPVEVLVIDHVERPTPN